MDLLNLIGSDVQKLQPRLRVIANGDTEVNGNRSESNPSVAMRSVEAEVEAPQRVQQAIVPPELEQVRISGSAQLAMQAGTPLGRIAPEGALVPAMALDSRAARPTLEGLTSEAVVSVFISLIDEKDESILGAGEADAAGEAHGAAPLRGVAVHRQGDVLTAEVPVSRLPDLAKHENVAFVQAGERVVVPQPHVSNAIVGEPVGARVVPGVDRAPPAPGAKPRVLMGIIDVGGFDFSHPDFLIGDGAGSKSTRFLSIWDQGARDGSPPRGFNYGHEYKRDELNTAIRDAERIGVAPYDVIVQEGQTPGSHGTHVASIAAGNHGVCPDSDIAAVLLSLGDDAWHRRLSFYDSTRIAHAVQYLFDLGAGRGQPVSINISLGTNGHAHDASSPVARWLDAALATVGRSICVAAGNAGQEAPETADDFGYIMGRIHTEGRIAAKGLVQDIEWVVVGNGIADLSENELEIWYGPQDRFDVQVKPPGEPDFMPVVQPGQFIENQGFPDGTTVSVYNELYHPHNGSNYIGIYLSPYLKQPMRGVRAGKWTVRLIGNDVRDGTYSAWVERDDPAKHGRLGPQEAWNFPSFFTVNSNVDRSSVSSLACGERTISVANLDDVRGTINVTSSQGPTRDGRLKPEIAAPGTDIVAANGFAPEDEAWIAMSGTSMASPYVAGVAGLMLSVSPRLTAAQIGGIIRRTARPLPAFDFNWRNDAGFGRIDPEACLAEAVRINVKADVTPKRGGET